MIARAWANNTPPDGGFKSMGVPSARQSGGYSVVSVPLAFRAGNMTVRVVLDHDGKASGLGLEYPRRPRGHHCTVPEARRAAVGSASMPSALR